MSIDSVAFMRHMEKVLLGHENANLHLDTHVQEVDYNSEHHVKIRLTDSAFDFDCCVLAAGPSGAEQFLQEEDRKQQTVSRGVSAFLIGDFNYLNSHILTLNAPGNQGLAYVVPSETGLFIGAVKEPDVGLKGGVFEEDRRKILNAVEALLPQARGSFETAVFTEALRDHSASPYCDFIQGSRVMQIGGGSGAGFTIAPVMADKTAEQVLNL